MKKFLFILLPLVLLVSCGENPHTSKKKLFDDRINSMVVIRYTIQFEIERDSRLVYGTVIDNKGLVIAHNIAADWIPDSYIKEIKVYPLGQDSKSYSAKYLGRSEVTGLNYFRIEESMWPLLKPITEYEHASLEVGDEMWGVCSLNLSDSFYKPYMTQGMLTLKEFMPWHYGIASEVVSCVGGPVFNQKGEFVGQTISALNIAYTLNLNNKQYQATLKRDNASEIVLLADDLMKHVLLNPEEQLYVDNPWIGLVGIEALPNPTLDRLGLKDQGALIISKIIKGSPADLAGMRPLDIILDVDGEPLNKFPDPDATAEYFSILMSEKKPGDSLGLTVLRNKEFLDLNLTVAPAPKRDNEVPRQYFPKIGFTAKEFSYKDGLRNHQYSLDLKGILAQFVRPNSPVEDAGLKRSDWIKEINGNTVDSYQDAINILSELENNTNAKGFVLLVERRNETKLLRVKLN